MTGNVLPRRGAPARPRFRRTLILVVYALVVCGSPLGQAGLLRIHLTTRHHVEGGWSYAQAAVPPTRHAVPAAASPAPSLPHEHDGQVHTHEERPGSKLAVQGGFVSEFYLAPETAVLEESPSRTGDPSLPSSREEWNGLVDTPPPRDLS